MKDFMQGRHPVGRERIHAENMCSFVRENGRTVCRFCGRPGSFHKSRSCKASQESRDVHDRLPGRRERLSRVGDKSVPSAVRFVRDSDMAADVLSLIQMLPHNVSEVVGVSRSGLVAASLVSMHLHVPLRILRQGRKDVIPASGGWRSQKNGGAPQNGLTLVVDDTVASGTSMKRTASMFSGQNVRYAAVYCNPEMVDLVDYVAKLLPLPHLLEWNLFNSVYLPKMMFDCDGVLCKDGAAHIPLYLPRREPITVCTARLHRHRNITDSWLRRWGVVPKELIMGPWESESHRDGNCIGTWKGENFARFMSDPTPEQLSSPGPWLFVESEPLQARRIFERAGGMVLCTKTGKIWQ